MSERKKFKLEAKAKKGNSAGGSLFFQFLAWGSLLLIIGSAFWFWLPQWGYSPSMISEPEKKLRELSRENPNAEVFEIKE